jgi:hypothetical protein
MDEEEGRQHTDGVAAIGEESTGSFDGVLSLSSPRFPPAFSDAFVSCVPCVEVPSTSWEVTRCTNAAIDR